MIPPKYRLASSTKKPKSGNISKAQRSEIVAMHLKYAMSRQSHHSAGPVRGLATRL